jgi:hypothetical protein
VRSLHPNAAAAIGVRARTKAARIVLFMVALLLLSKQETTNHPIRAITDA